MTQFNAPAYDIQRSTGQCAFTGRKLEPGETYVATLVELDETDPAGKSSAPGIGLRRLDVSLQAWEQGSRPERLFSFWRSVVRQPNEKKKLFVDDEVLVHLFHRLGDSEQEQRLAFRFVLALILMRKKLLRYDGSRKETLPDGTIREWWRMTPKGQQETLEVLNPHIDAEQIQKVGEQLGEILEAEL